MKTSELMIGDIITFKDSVQADETPIPIKVIALGYQHSDDENEALVQIGNDETCDIVTIDEEFVGYPLTAEILEKNGWKSLMNGNGDFILTNPFAGNSATVTKTINGFELRNGAFNGLGILFVHELQHCLKLVGIDKEIIL